MASYKNPVYLYARSKDQDAERVVHHPIIVVGAGPVGLTSALEAGVRNMPVLVLDDDNTVSHGSRAVCYSKRTLEIMDRFDCAAAMIEKGVSWEVGKIFFRDQLISQFNLNVNENQKIPAFINLQQYYFEEILIKRLRNCECAELRWNNKVTAVSQSADKVELSINTPDGVYHLSCDWLIVADGANSPIREHMGLESTGRRFKDRFLIADVIMRAGFPPERWFAFDPSYHPGQSSLLHRQPDDLWRLDFQLGWDADPEEEKKPENVIPRVKAMLGDDTKFELEWCSVYSFRCRRMQKFRHGRVFFTGDAAHQVSPFGARGANSGVEDSNNLIWKLDWVRRGLAADSLLDSYSEERVYAADENILNSSRSTDFITPKSNISRCFRDAVLDLSKEHVFARALVNSGRLAAPSFLIQSSLNTVDESEFNGDMVPGAVMVDAPIESANGHRWLLEKIIGEFHLLCFINTAADLDEHSRCSMLQLAGLTVPVKSLLILPTGKVKSMPSVTDPTGLCAELYDAQPGTCYLIRPDQHIAARWRKFDYKKIVAASKLVSHS